MKKRGSNLPVAEVHQLINRIQKFPQNSASQRAKILEGFENLVHSIVKKYKQSTDEDYKDFLQVGFIGLLISVEKFDASQNVKFITFATKVIDTHILNYLSSERKHYVNQFRSRLFLPEETGDEEISSIEQIADSEFDDSFEEKLISKIDSKWLRTKLRFAVRNLPKRQQQAVELFFYEDNSKSEIAEKLRVSRPRVTALLGDAIGGLRRRLQIAG